jgi:phage terminase large subunit-like protein
MKLNKHIREYIGIVRGGEFKVCEEQLLLCDFVEKVFLEEDIFVDDEQLEKYLAYQKYFPFDLYPWEKFCFALHNCTYKDIGILRFPNMLIFVGRGAGKNGYLGFEDFCLLTPVNGIRNYNIDNFATSEKQAKMSWKDVYDVLESHPQKMRKHFIWTKQLIVNRKTNSEYAYNTSSHKTKDGYRPGKVNHDEYHGYENGDLIDVTTTGLGKVPMPRRTVISSDGRIRGGPLDEMKAKARKVLDGEEYDNGWIYFICKIDKESEIHDREAWHKANPSLRYKPDLFELMKSEYVDYISDPVTHSGFATKRMNFPTGTKENVVTAWENVEATNRAILENALRGKPCIAGFDYARVNDFISAGLLFIIDKSYIWLTHTFVCAKSVDLPRIKAPLREWESSGLLTFIDADEISPELPVVWAVNKAAELGSPILRAGIDSFRSHWMIRALDEYGFSSEHKQDFKKIFTVRPSDEMRYIPVISSAFINKRIILGDNPLMRWAINNAKLGTSGKGNLTYDKIEPKSRKTDPFKAFVQAVIAAEDLLEKRSGKPILLEDLPDVITY